MKTFLKNTILLASTILLLIPLSACSSEPSREASPVVSATATPLPTAATDIEPAPAEPTMTEITIDGDPGDWADYPVVKRDPLGDSEQGVLDFGDLHLFRNRDAVYLMAELGDPSAGFKEIAFSFKMVDRYLYMDWNGSSRDGHIAQENLEHYDWADLGTAGYTRIALGSVLEARIDLRDLGMPQEMVLDAIQVQTGDCCTPPAWHPADLIEQIGEIPTINEFDSPELLERIPSYVLEDWLQLPQGWHIERVLEPPLPDINQITISQDGTIFVELGLMTQGVATIDPYSGQVTRVLDRYWDSGIAGGIAGGPDDTFFIAMRNEIWQVSSDGNYEVWGTVRYGEGTHPTYYTDSGRLIGWKYNDPSCVIEILPDGTTQDLACGFSEVWDVIADADDNLYVSDWVSEHVTMVSADGTRQILADKTVFRDPIDLAFDPAGDLYMNYVADQPFWRLDADTKRFVPLNPDMTKCAFHAADFVFADELRVVFMDPTYSMLTWADTAEESCGVLVSNEGVNTLAAEIGPDGALYYATFGSRGDPPAHINKLTPGMTPEMVVDGLPDKVYDLAFAADGGLYIAAWGENPPLRALYYLPPGSAEKEMIADPQHMDIRSLAGLPNGNVLGWVRRSNRLVEFSPEGLVKEITFYPPELIEEFSIDYAADGYLYGFAELARNERKGPVVYRQLLRVDLESGAAEIVYQKDIEKALAGGSLDVAPDGSLWVILFPDFELYRVMPDGTAEQFAVNLPIDSWRVSVDEAGDVYINSPSGIYRLYQD